MPWMLSRPPRPAAGKIPTMTRSQRRLAALLGGLLAALVVLALLYRLGMARLEGQPRGFWQSLEWAAGTVSTTGYGVDQTWHHPVMILFVTAAQFVGVFFLFLVVPVYLLPVLEERFVSRLPRTLRAHAQHVVIYRHGPAVETLFEELRLAGVPAVVLEEDERQARRLAERGIEALSSPLSPELFRRASLAAARGLVLNGPDEANAMAALMAREAGFAGEIVALVHEPRHRKPIALAGASRVFTPRHVLGATLAARASQRVSPLVAGLERLGAALQVDELRIAAASPLAGRTLAEAAIGEAVGATILGQWVRGRLQSPAGADLRLEAGGVLIAAGDEGALARLAELACPSGHGRGGRFVVAGCGEVGRVAIETLRTVGEQVVGVDRDPASAADEHGDFLDADCLARLELATARAAILALDSDAATLFATLVVRESAPGLRIVARVNEAANVERVLRAGADFAFSIAQVTGQIVSHRLLGSTALAVEAGLAVRSIRSPAVAGLAPRELGLEERAGCSLVAIERDGTLLTPFGGHLRLAESDTLYLCGSKSGLARAAELLPSGESPA